MGAGENRGDAVEEHEAEGRMGMVRHMQMVIRSDVGAEKGTIVYGGIFCGGRGGWGRCKRWEGRGITDKQLNSRSGAAGCIFCYLEETRERA